MIVHELSRQLLLHSVLMWHLVPAGYVTARESTAKREIDARSFIVEVRSEA